MPSRPVVKWFLLTGGLSLGACATEAPEDPLFADLSVDVRREHSLATLPSPTTFMIVARSREQASDPLWAVSVNQVAGLLESRGHRRVFPGGRDPARWRVDVETGAGRRCDPARTPSSQLYRYGWDGAGVQPVAGGSSPGPDTARPCSRLSVHIVARGRTLYQGVAEARGGQADSVAAVPRLARALLEPFPGPVGVFRLKGHEGPENRKADPAS